MGLTAAIVSSNHSPAATYVDMDGRTHTHTHTHTSWEAGFPVRFSLLGSLEVGSYRGLIGQKGGGSSSVLGQL